MHNLSSEVQGGACGARAAAMLAHTISLGVGMLSGLLERAKLLFAIVDLISVNVNGTSFRSRARRVRNPHRSFFKFNKILKRDRGVVKKAPGGTRPIAVLERVSLCLYASVIRRTFIVRVRVSMIHMY